MTEENSKQGSKRFCECGCGESIPCYDNRGRPRSHLPGHHIKGKNNPRWNGGMCITRWGYRYVKAEDHPNATLLGYVMEHRLIMEKHIGRYLTKDEDVHHLNGNTLDNRIDNLYLMKHGYHSSFTNIGGGRPPKRKPVRESSGL